MSGERKKNRKGSKEKGGVRRGDGRKIPTAPQSLLVIIFSPLVDIAINTTDLTKIDVKIHHDRNAERNQSILKFDHTIIGIGCLSGIAQE
jgi:hypothetical protein